MVNICTQLLILVAVCHSVSGLKGSPVVRPRRETEFASVSTASTCKATPFDMVPAINFPRYISSSCSADQQWADRVAWAESSLLAHAMSQWRPQGDYQRAIDLYLGPTRLNLSSSEYKSEYLPRLEKIIALQDILYTGKDVGNNVFYVYCGDGDFPASFFDGPGKNCTQGNVNNKRSCCEAGSLAYSWIEEGSAFTKFITVLCPKFFAMTTMSNDLRYLFQHNDQHTNPYKLMHNSGGVHFHQSVYWAAAQSNLTMHGTGEYQEAANTMLEVERGNQTLETIWNAQYAEPWRDSATAMFQMQTFCLADAPHDSLVGCRAGLCQTLFLGPALWSFGKISTPWVGPQDPNDSKSQPNMTAWTKTQPQLADKKNYAAYTASAIPTPSCIGAIQNVPGDLLKESFDEANLATDQLCGTRFDGSILSQANTRTFINVGKGGSSFGSVAMSIVLADKLECAAGFEVDAKTCKDMFHSIINGCIVDNNDEAWGGSVVFGCGIYAFEPWVRPAPTPWVGEW